MKSLIRIIILCSLVFTARSQNTIASVHSGNWNNPATWNSNTVPGINDHVIISMGHTVQADSFVNCHHLFIDVTSTLQATANSTLMIAGNWDNSGTFLGSGSTVQFQGGALQVISGLTPTRFNNIIVTNNSSVALNTNAGLKGNLSLLQGTFTTTGYQFTLLSDSNGTAAIGTISNGSNFIGPITMQRYIGSQVPGWRFLASPVYVTTLQDWANDFSTFGFPGSSNPALSFCSINMYDETVGGPSDSGFVNPGSVTDSITVGKGYWCWINNAPVTVDVTGIPAKFSQTFSLTLTPSAGKGQDGWNLISNPYPCAIDWDSPMWSKTGINNAVYIWDPVNNRYSSYVNGIGINGGTNIIASSQAFWIEAAQSDALIMCDERVKTTGDHAVQRTSSTVVSKNYIKFRIDGNSVSDETAICFSSSASAAYDAGEDALRIPTGNNMAPSIYTSHGNTVFSINSLPMNTNDTIIPLFTKTGTSGTYTLSNLQAGSGFSDRCLYLEDVLTGTSIDLHTAISYTFFMQDTTQQARFMLHIGSALQTSQIATRCAYSQNGMAIAQGQGNGPWIYTWKDLLGNTLAIHTSQTADTLKNLASGDYAVSIQSNNMTCAQLGTDIHVNKAQPLQAATSINHVSCPGSQNGLIQVTGISGGEAPYSYAWSNGSTGNMIQQLNIGVYTLIVTDHKGCSDTSFQVVKQLSGLHAAFAANHDTAYMAAGQAEVQFADHSSGQKSSWWEFGDGTSLSNSKQASHAYLAPGTYTVTLIAQSGTCSDTARKVVQISTVSGINAVDTKNSVNIYNNTTTAFVAFDLENAQLANLGLYDMEGRLLYASTIMAHKSTEQISLPETRGIYLIQIILNGKPIQKKIVN